MTREERIIQLEEILRMMEYEEALLTCVRRTSVASHPFQKLEERMKDGEVYLEADVFASDKICVKQLRTENVIEELISLHEQHPMEQLGIKLPLRFAKLGGNVLRGGDGVEESLCRSTTLYPCYDKCVDGYVYLPDVLCLRDGNGNLLKDDERFFIHVIIEYGKEEKGQDAKILLFE